MSIKLASKVIIIPHAVLTLIAGYPGWDDSSAAEAVSACAQGDIRQEDYSPDAMTNIYKMLTPNNYYLVCTDAW